MAKYSVQRDINGAQQKWESLQGGEQSRRAITFDNIDAVRSLPDAICHLR